MAYYNMTINNKNNNQTIMWQKGNKTSSNEDETSVLQDGSKQKKEKGNKKNRQP